MHVTGFEPFPPIAHAVVYVLRAGSRRWQANPPGTLAETGGISGNRLAIQVINHGSRLALVDLKAHALEVLPPPFNLPHLYPWRPSLSGSWLLYGRIDFGALRYQIILANLATHELRIVDQATGHGAYAAPGQINGNYATWITCPDNHCRAYRYTISTRHLVEMPPLGGASYWQYGPSVNRNGTVYFGLGRGCYDGQIVRWDRGQTQTIYRLPANSGFNNSYTTNSNPPTIYFDQTRCGLRQQSAIYAITDTLPRQPPK
jgi:hypothetical protein